MLGRCGTQRVGALALTGLAVLTSCSSRVWMMVPARVDLNDYGQVGVVEFEGGEGELCQLATREFRQRLIQARPGIRMLEVDAPDAHQDLSAVFVGSVEFSKLSPTIGVSSSLVGVQARAEILGTLSVSLVDPKTGATLWMSSSNRSATVASAGVASSGQGSFGFTDVAGIKAAMVSEMAEDVTFDFRDQFFRKKLEEIPPHYQVTYPDGVEVYAPPQG